jgi:hypothetical protein
VCDRQATVTYLDDAGPAALKFTGTAQEKIFENELPFAAYQRTPAFTAGYLPVFRQIGLNPDDAIFGRTVWTLEGLVGHEVKPKD